MHMQRILKRMVDRVVGRLGPRARALVGRKRARDAEEAPCDTFFRFPRAPEPPQTRVADAMMQAVVATARHGDDE